MAILTIVIFIIGIFLVIGVSLITLVKKLIERDEQNRKDAQEKENKKD